MILASPDRVGAKNPNYVSGGDKSQVKVLACCSATGYVFPPFDRQSLNQGMTSGEVPGTLLWFVHQWVDNW